MNDLITEITEKYPEEEFLIADGFDDAIIGFDVNRFVLIYSISKCVRILMNEGMKYEEAQEHLWFNTFSAYVGEKTPTWCDDEF